MSDLVIDNKCGLFILFLDSHNRDNSLCVVSKTP